MDQIEQIKIDAAQEKSDLQDRFNVLKEKAEEDFAVARSMGLIR